ncbi:hypothetical protein CBF23_002415 [Marinomonas agarivorans]|nr:hypothetical protein CBF23_002415 [Marinomonas agarivorans]
MNHYTKIFFALFTLGAMDANAASCQYEKPDWAEYQDPETCDIYVKGQGGTNIQFHAVGQLSEHDTPGSKSPRFVDHLDSLGGRCGLGNALWWNNHVHNAPQGADLSNPNSNSHLGYFYIKDSLHEGTNHGPGGHEDLLQLQGAINNGSWLVIQDSTFKNADTNALMQVGSGDHGYGNGPGSSYACDDPFGGTGGVLLQGVTIGPNDPGYTGSAQIGVGKTGRRLPEIWFVDVEYNGLGISIFEGVEKVVVVGGKGGNKGWPGPLKVRYPRDSITAESCSAGGWHNGQCCPNGLVNTNQQIMNWDGRKGDNPSTGAIPVYCYDSVDKALAHEVGGQRLHKAPPFIELSTSGWGDTPDDQGNDLDCGTLNHNESRIVTTDKFVAAKVTDLALCEHVTTTQTCRNGQITEEEYDGFDSCSLDDDDSNNGSTFSPDYQTIDLASLTLAGGAQQANDQLILNGTSAYAHTNNLLDTTRSYAVSAKVTLNSDKKYQAILSQDADNLSAFFLQTSNAKTFGFTIAKERGNSASLIRLKGTTRIQTGVEYEVSAIYDNQKDTIALYVNGALEAESTFKNPIQSSGDFVVGAALWKGNRVDFLDGNVTDIRIAGTTQLPDSGSEPEVNEAPVVEGFSTTIKENVGQNFVVGDVKATDKENDSLGFTIIDGNNGDVFAIDNNGVLSINNHSLLNFAQTPSYSLKVAVTDGQNIVVQDIFIALESVFVDPIFTQVDLFAREILPHQADFSLSNGAIAFEFTANNTQTRQGLFSKDHYQFGEGGHLSIYLEKEKVIARIQDNEQSYELSAPIQQDKQHHLLLTFGVKGLILYLDGIELGSDSYQGGMENNKEDAVFGALKWSSKQGTNNRISNEYQGIMQNLNVFNTQVLPSDIRK